MSVTVTFSGASGGSSLANLVDQGSISPAGATDEQDIFIRHTAAINSITSCAFYLTRYSGVDYPGTDADADLAEVLTWGDNTYAQSSDYGGLYINQVAPSGWVTGQAFGSSSWEIFRTGYGDSNHQINLKKESVNIGNPGGVDGIIPVAGEAHIQLKWEAPSTVSSSGKRAVMLVMAYSATS